MFYKYENNQLVSAESVILDSVTLTEETKDANFYPVEGWFWFDSEMQAQAVTLVDKSKVTMLQARLELSRRGLLDSVDAILSRMPASAQLEWEYATEVKRDNHLVKGLQYALSMNESDMDSFFISAGLL